MKCTINPAIVSSFRASELSSNFTTTKSPLLIPRDYRNVWNDTLFPENSAAKAENYCRNPSRIPSGTILFLFHSS